MGRLPTIFCAFFCATANAGTVSLETDAAVEVQFGNATIARASQSGTFTIGELPEGPVTLRFIRQGKAPMDAEIQVPELGTTTMVLTGDTLTIAGKVSTMMPLENPIVVLQPAENQRFTIIINGNDRRQFSSETILDDLSPGKHQIEFRSEDQLLVWVRGTLELKPGDAVSLRVEEGRMVKAGGTKEAWTATEGR